MNKLWFRELGFHNNPFSIKPAAYHDNLEGMQAAVDRLIFTVLKGKVAYVEGNYGDGKTTVLKRLINEFGGKKQVVYFSRNRVDEMDTEKLLLNKKGILGRLFNRKGKNLILLLDEAQELTKAEADAVLKLYQDEAFKSIVMVGASFNEKSFAKDWKIDHIKLKKVPADRAVAVIRKRIGVLPLLSDEIIKEVYTRVSGQNIRQLLKDCESLCRYAVEYGYDVIDAKLVKEALGVFVPDSKKEEVKETAEEAPKEQNDEPLKIKKKAPAKKKAVKKAKSKKTDKKVEKEPKVEAVEAKEAAEEKPEVKAEQPVEDKAAEIEGKDGEKVFVPDDVDNSAAMEEMLSMSTDELIGEDKYY